MSCRLIVRDAGPGVTYKMITVQSHRRVSDRVAERLGIRHETPQAILLRDGQSVWSASHFRITADAKSGRVSSSPAYHSHAAPRTPLESPYAAFTAVLRRGRRRRTPSTAAAPLV